MMRKWFIGVVWFTMLGTVTMWAGNESAPTARIWLAGLLYWALAVTFLRLSFRRKNVY